jgi:hypothetical protein
LKYTRLLTPPQAGSIRWTVAAHILNNFMALGGKLFALSPDLD